MITFDVVELGGRDCGRMRALKNIFPMVTNFFYNSTIYDEEKMEIRMKGKIEELG